jgi:hypothetical protein
MASLGKRCSIWKLREIFIILIPKLPWKSLSNSVII